MGVLGYSTTPGSNNNALSGVGSLAENVMPIKQINDAQRQQLADIAQLYGDIVTGIYTTGTSSAYLAATASGHTVYNNTMALRLRFHVDSAAGAVTVNVNGLGAKSLKIFATTGSRDPVVGEIKADMAYDCVYIAALNCIVVTDPVVPTVDLSSRQPLDADLTALAALATTGLIARTGAGAVSARTVTAGAGMVVTNGDGVAGNPTVAAFGGTAGPTAASGSAVNFSSIPANANKITVFFDSLSLNGTDNIFLQIGTGGVAETTGYVSAFGEITGAAAVGSTATTGFALLITRAANALSGIATLEKEPGSNSWHFSSSIANAGTSAGISSGRKPLAGVLDFLRVIPVSANTFDGGTISIRWSA